MKASSGPAPTPISTLPAAMAWCSLAPPAKSASWTSSPCLAKNPFWTPTSFGTMGIAVGEALPTWSVSAARPGAAASASKAANAIPRVIPMLPPPQRRMAALRAAIVADRGATVERAAV